MLRSSPGFTLIELSIVLVIIGLIVGGVLVGQNLISAAAVRAQVTQIEKYNTAANTFREKYGYLPGDIPNPFAAQFGFAARGQYPGQGDGNGLLQGNWDNTSAGGVGNANINGETGMFWVDLSKVNLIDGSFHTSTPTMQQTTTSAVANYLPPAKIGQGNYVYIWSGGYVGSTYTNYGSGNYYGLSAVRSINDGTVVGPEGLTVAQANAIDTKIDDGFPQTGNVIAIFLNRTGSGNFYTMWAGTGNTETYTSDNQAYTTATPGSSTTCYDNSSAASGTPGVAGATQHYSVEISNGSYVDCALSFQMQAGD